MDELAVTNLLRRQDGVVARRQVREAGGTDNDIERLLRRREWARIHDGVYVTHTGQPTWTQRAWAAALYHWPSALDGRSALCAYGLRPPSGDPIELAVPAARRVRDPAGVISRRLESFDDSALLGLSPPRVRLEHAVLGVASAARREDEAVAVLADVCQNGRTTPARLAMALGRRTRLPRRALLVEVLHDVGSGAYSTLERRYLRHVERAHGLPGAQRQRRVTVGRSPAYRDVEYLGLGLVVELDGRLGHEAAADRWADLDRDVAAVLDGRTTVRLSWAQVLQPCRCAAAVARLLHRSGWTGEPRACGPGCVLEADSGALPAPGADETPLSVGHDAGRRRHSMAGQVSMTMVRPALRVRS